MTHAKSGLICALVVGASSLAAPAAGQGFLMPEAPERGVGLEVSHPTFKDRDLFDMTFATSVWYLTGQLPLTSRISGRADIPLAFADFKGNDVLGSSTVMGNPYVGVAFTAIPELSVELGTRLPLTTADEESFADVIGLLGDMQRSEAFLEDVIPVNAGAVYRHHVTPAFALQARGGVTQLFFRGDSSDEDNITFLDYGLFGTYAMNVNARVVNEARFGAGFSGRWNASEDADGFSENSLHMLGLTADLSMGRVRPGILVRIPLDEAYREVLRSSVGLYVQVPLL
jgi:hypothetical protein